MFEPFEGVPSYPALEREVLQFWQERHIFDQLQRQNQNGLPWQFQDGPITANNRMGVHHAWGRTYKDLFDRFHAMQGRRLRWQNGFDCQGLWVEVEVEKQLGFRAKADILDFGMANFSRACRARVEEFARVIIAQSNRLGMWMDWDRSYFTYDDSNIEGIWGFLARCHAEGWLAPDYRVMPWCPRCETSLSQNESADAYKDITHRSVFVQLPLAESDDWLLAWTTTPWTLTANVALVVQRLRKRKRGEEKRVLPKGNARFRLGAYIDFYNNARNSSLVNPASRTIPPIVIGVDGIVARNSQDANSIRHNDVLALTDDAKPRFLKCSYGTKMINTRKSGHNLSRHFNFSDVPFLHQRINSQ